MKEKKAFEDFYSVFNKRVTRRNAKSFFGAYFNNPMEPSEITSEVMHFINNIAVQFVFEDQYSEVERIKFVAKIGDLILETDDSENVDIIDAVNILTNLLRLTKKNDISASERVSIWEAYRLIFEAAFKILGEKDASFNIISAGGLVIKHMNLPNPTMKKLEGLV